MKSMKQTIDAYTLYPGGRTTAHEYMSTKYLPLDEMNWHGAPRFVYRVRETRFRILYEAFAVCMRSSLSHKVPTGSTWCCADPNTVFCRAVSLS